MNIIGRRFEIRLLTALRDSRTSEFVALYGRRRVGKTYLVEQFYDNAFAFYVVGLSGGRMKDQLEAFRMAINWAGGNRRKAYGSWREAFSDLIDLLSSESVRRDPLSGKKIVFLDELPWIDTQKSDFFTWFEYFWNSWGHSQSDLILIACGSASAWIKRKLCQSKAGFYRRVTQEINLQPFTLGECEEYCRDFLHLGWTRKQVVDAYMVFGGIPQYYRMLRPELSLAGNIDLLCLAQSGTLRDEFDTVTSSLFKAPTSYVAVLEAVARNRGGVSRIALNDDPQLPSGKELTNVLGNLVACGFVREFSRTPKHKRGLHYQLLDPFTRFHLDVIEPRKVSRWTDYVGTPSHAAWAGYAFELVCLLHVRQIKRALGIENVISDEYAWKSMESSRPGAQIDLIIDRRDDVVELCEMKYCQGEFVIDAAYAAQLRNKVEAFRREHPTCRKAIHIVMVTLNGVAHNAHYREVVTSEVQAEELFG